MPHPTHGLARGVNPRQRLHSSVYSLMTDIGGSFLTPGRFPYPRGRHRC